MLWHIREILRFAQDDNCVSKSSSADRRVRGDISGLMRTEMSPLTLRSASFAEDTDKKCLYYNVCSVNKMILQFNGVTFS